MTVYGKRGAYEPFFAIFANGEEVSEMRRFKKRNGQEMPSGLNWYLKIMRKNSMNYLLLF